MAKFPTRYGQKSHRIWLKIPQGMARFCCLSHTFIIIIEMYRKNLVKRVGGEKLVVRKANDLVEAKSQLTAIERKAMAIAIAFVSRIDGAQAVAEIKFGVLKKALEGEWGREVDREFRRQLKNVLERLKSKRELALIEIPIKNYVAWLRENGKEDWLKKLGLEGDGDGYILCGVIDDIKVSPSAGKIEVRFNRFISPLVVELKRRYTSYELKYLMLLDHRYSSALYELFKKNEKLGSFKMELDRLKKILGVEDKPTYKIWGEFWKKILKPALEEINEKTDIRVEIEKVRGNYGRVEGIIFHISRKKEALTSRITPRRLLEILASDKALNVSVEELAEALLSFERVNPAVAIWFLLHYPKGDTSGTVSNDNKR